MKKDTAVKVAAENGIIDISLFDELLNVIFFFVFSIINTNLFI